MPLDSELIARLDQGLVLELRLEGHAFRAYVALRSAEVDEVAALVPTEQFEAAQDVHVAALHEGDNIAESIHDVLFNLNPGDVLVFLCTSPSAYAAALAELGQSHAAAS